MGLGSYAKAAICGRGDDTIVKASSADVPWERSFNPCYDASMFDALQ
jgi:hypothetical protein